MSFTIVIPSRNWANLSRCLAAIYRHEQAARVVVVDDGLEVRPQTVERMEITVVDGAKPFIFSRNVNLGIAASGADDVLILNDDAMLETPGGFSALAAAALARPDIGVMSAAVDSVGNANQWPRHTGQVRPEGRMVCFVCVYIRRAVLDAVGPMDERFGGIDAQGQEIYGHEDDDYCYRVRRAGLKLGVFDGCCVNHTTLHSTFRTGHHRPLEPGRRVFVEKWGSYPL